MFKIILEVLFGLFLLVAEPVDTDLQIVHPTCPLALDYKLVVSVHATNCDLSTRFKVPNILHLLNELVCLIDPLRHFLELLTVRVDLLTGLLEHLNKDGFFMFNLSDSLLRLEKFRPLHGNEAQKLIEVFNLVFPFSSQVSRDYGGPLLHGCLIETIVDATVDRLSLEKPILYSGRGNESLILDNTIL